eukprot:gene14146-15623_t
MLSWILFLVVIKALDASGSSEKGEIWMIKSTTLKDELSNEPTANDAAKRSSAPLGDPKKIPELFLITPRALERPTREPKETDSEGFESAVSSAKNSKKSEKLTKSAVPRDKTDSKAANHYLLRVRDGDFSAGVKREKIETVPKKSQFSEKSENERASKRTTTNSKQRVRSYVTKQRQEIENTPEAFAGQRVGKPYGDPDGYQTIGDGIYLMNNEGDQPFEPGLTGQNLEMTADQADAGETASSSQEGEQATETSKQAMDSGAAQVAPDSAGQKPTSKAEQPALNAGQSAPVEIGKQASIGSASQHTPTSPAERLISNKADWGKSESGRTKASSAEVSGAVSSGAASHAPAGSKVAKTSSEQEISEPSAGNLNQILTKLGTDEGAQKSGTAKNTTVIANKNGHSTKVANNGTKVKPSSNMGQYTAPVYANNKEPAADVEAVTPKELNVLETFQNTLKLEDKKISKEMSSSETQDKNHDAAYAAMTKAMIQNLNQQQLDRVVDRMRTEDSAFIKKNPYVLNKDTLLHALDSVKYKDNEITKRGFLTSNDNIPVEKLYNSLLREDEWLKSGMDGKAEPKDMINGEYSKDSPDDEDKVSELLNFAEKEDVNIPNDVQDKSIEKVSSHKEKLYDALKIKQSGSKTSRHKSAGYKGKKTRKREKSKLMIFEPSASLISSARAQRNSKQNTEKVEEKISEKHAVRNERLKDNEEAITAKEKGAYYTDMSSKGKQTSSEESTGPANDNYQAKENNVSNMKTTQDKYKEQRKPDSFSQTSRFSQPYSSKKLKSKKRVKKVRSRRRHGKGEIIMKEGAMKDGADSETIDNWKKYGQKQTPARNEDDKEYYWHGTKKPETRQLPTDPTEVMRKFGKVSNILPTSIENDMTGGESKFVGDKNNIANDGTESPIKSYNKKNNGNNDEGFLTTPVRKINENELSSTAFFTASDSHYAPTKVFEKQADSAISPTVMQDALKMINNNDMQDVKGYIDKDDSKTLAFFDQGSMQPKLEEFDVAGKLHGKESHRHSVQTAVSPEKSNKQVKVVLHLPELNGRGGVHQIHGKNSGVSIGSIQAIDSNGFAKQRKVAKKVSGIKTPGIGQRLAEDDEDSLEEVLYKPTAKLVQFHQPTTLSGNEMVPTNSIGQETKEWSKESSEGKETVPMEGSDEEPAGRERNDMAANSLTGKNILDLINQSEVGFKDNLLKEGANAGVGDSDNDEFTLPGDNTSKEPGNHRANGKKKEKNARPEKQQRFRNRNEAVALLQQDDPNESKQILESTEEREENKVSNIYADQMRYDQKQKEVSELMPTEAVNQIKEILRSDDHMMPLKFLEKDRQMFNRLNEPHQPIEHQNEEITKQVSEEKQENEEDSINRPNVAALLSQLRMKNKKEQALLSEAAAHLKPTVRDDSQIQMKNKEANAVPMTEPNIEPAYAPEHQSVLANLLSPGRRIQVKGGKIFGGKILGGQINGGTIRGGLVEGGDIEGGSIIGGKITGGFFKNGRMENGVMYNGTVEGGVIKGGEIYGGRMVSGLMEGGKLRGGSIFGGKVTGGEIDGGSLKSGEVRGGFLRKGSVEGGVLKGGSIEGGHLMGGVMLGGHLKGGIVKSGIIRGGTIEGGVVEGGVIDDGVVIKGGVIRGFDDKASTTDDGNESKESSTDEKKPEENKVKYVDNSDPSSQLLSLKSVAPLPTNLYKIHVDTQASEEHTVEPNLQAQDVGGSNSNGRQGGQDAINILGAPESWPVKNKESKNSDEEEDKNRVLPVTYSNTVQKTRPKPVATKQHNSNGAKPESTNKLRELLSDLDQGRAGQKRIFGGKNAEEFEQSGEANGGQVSQVFMFKKPTASAIAWGLAHRDNSKRTYKTTTKTIQDTPEEPIAPKYHWSLNSIKGGKILGSPGKDMSVIGGVNIHNGIATFNEGLTRGYIDAGDYQGECLSDPDVCKNGLTISITNKIRKDSIYSQTRMYLFDSGAGSSDSRGMALWVNRGRIEGAVSTRKGTWCLGEDVTPFSDKWVDLVMSWKQNQGLYLYANCELLAVSGFGTGCDVCDKKNECHQKDANTHFMIARPNKGPHFKLTHFSSGDISVYENFFTIDGAKQHCGSNNDYKMQNSPKVAPVTVGAISHVPITSPWDSTVLVMKKHKTYTNADVLALNKAKSAHSNSDSESHIWPTPSGMSMFSQLASKLATANALDEIEKASGRQEVKVNGGYSQWTAWTTCTGACGGTSMSVRYCNNPVPKLNGEDCSVIGPARRTRICTSNNCLGTSKKDKVESNDYGRISKRKEIVKNHPNNVNQAADLDKLQQEFEILKER